MTEIDNATILDDYSPRCLKGTEECMRSTNGCEACDMPRKARKTGHSWKAMVLLFKWMFFKQYVAALIWASIFMVPAYIYRSYADLLFETWLVTLVLAGIIDRAYCKYKEIKKGLE